MTEVVLPLDHELCQVPAVAGNKAATLSRLIRDGYPVPPGACVTAEAAAGPKARWEAALPGSLSEIPPPWVVRSSSTAEDSPTHSLAGAFESIVGVEDLKLLPAAVIEVQKSLRSDTVRRRVKNAQLDIGKVKIAVLIQSVVPATASGVAFGCDPVSGAPVVIVEANYGLPQTVVDGSITPDGFEVPADGVVRRSLGSKREQVFLSIAGAVERRATTPLERAAFAVDDPTVARLAQLVRRLGDLLGEPQDVEWASVDGELFLLQARPITTVGLA